MEYDYVYAIETNDHVLMRNEPRTGGQQVSEIASGIRVLAAEPVDGGDYSDCGGGSKWWPVAYDMSGTTLHGFIAEKCCRVV
jgi:hypothetical protein